MNRTPSCRAGLAGIFVLLIAPVCAHQSPATASAAGQLVVEKVRGASLEGNASGEDPDRTVSVYLPAGYDSSSQKRYPVVYLLHGIGGTDKDWTGGQGSWATLMSLMDQGTASGRLQEMIVVMPDQRTQAGGSFYTNSEVTGYWEDFTTRDLVEWTDRRFRTLAEPAGRGIAGHSMGGYGALMIAMKHPDIFSVVYAMNPAVLGWAEDFSPDNPAFRSLLARSGWSEIQDRYEAALICVAQAFSPNRQRPPFLADFPFRLDDDRLVADVAVKQAWENRFPTRIAPRYRDNLMRLTGIRFDSGTEDQFGHIPATSRELSRVLTQMGIAHIFEEYNGDHRNRLWGRTGRIYTEVLPWFSLLLEPAR